MAIKIKQIPKNLEFQGEKVLVRVDLNVPIIKGNDGHFLVGDDVRIKQALRTIIRLSQARARVILCTHLGEPAGKKTANFSLQPVADALQDLLPISISEFEFVTGWNFPVLRNKVNSLPEGGISIYQYDGSISRISTPELDEMLDLVGPNNISLTTERWYGLSFVVVNANLTTYVYCIEDKTWWERPGTRLWYRCAGNSIGNTLYTYGISNTSTGGKVYVINPTAFTFQDDSVAYTAVWQTSPEDNGTSKRKFCGEIDLVCDREIEASALTLMYSDDDYASFTTWGTIDLSDARPRATRLGSYIRRAWRGEHSANTPFRIRYLEGQVEIGQ